ncbi:MAG: LON peptidase substrate-binding domain-containing protein [Pseudomonadales bacterium]
MPIIPLFPLRSVLLPHARIPLQIFEPRYMDMVKRCLKDQSGFGVILITEGDEVFNRARDRMPELAETGCYAKIVDWDALPGGRLEITIEGECQFRLGKLSQGKDRLISAQVEWVANPEPTELSEQYSELADVLLDLVDHPEVKRLNYILDNADAYRVASQLGQLLPITEAEKLAIMELDSTESKLEALDAALEMLTN